MNLFNRLFGRILKNQVPSKPEHNQETKPARQIPGSEEAKEPEVLPLIKVEPADSNNIFEDKCLNIGDLQNKLDECQASIAILEECYQNDTKSTDYAHDLSLSYKSVGDIYLKLGDFLKAIDIYKTSISILEILCHSGPYSVEYVRDLLVLYNTIGNLYLKIGDTLKANEQQQKSKELLQSRIKLVKGQRNNLEKGGINPQNEDILENIDDVFNQFKPSIKVNSVDKTGTDLKNLAGVDSGTTNSENAFNVPAVNQSVNYDLIRFSAFGPTSIKTSDSVIVDIWAFTSTQHDEVIERTSKSRKTIEHGTVGPISALTGTKFLIYLFSDYFEIQTGIQPIIWFGEPANVSFLINVPKNLNKGYYPCSAIILQENIPVVTLSFELLVDNRTNKPAFQGHDRFIKSLFASYAAEDRQKVILWTEGARSVGTNVFLDVLSLRQGQDWEKELWEQIPKNDILVLFWSLSASKSKWVEKEWRCALHVKGIESIYPVPFADPRDVPPPQELASVKHFNDLSFIIYEYEKNRK